MTVLNQDGVLRGGSDSDDDDSVEISDVDVSDDDDQSDAPSTVPSEQNHNDDRGSNNGGGGRGGGGLQLREDDYDDDEGEGGDRLAPLDDDMVGRNDYYDDDDDDDDDHDEGDADVVDGDDTALLQVHEEKFIERLNHFMDVQRKVEERMIKIDPEGRMKEIEVVVHSDGIVEADGSYKLKYQQQDAEGEPAQNLGEVYEAAYQIKQSLRDLLDSMVDKVKGLDYVDAKIVELKPRDRANEKAREEYLTRTPGPPETWLYDILRASVTCSTMKQMEAVNKFLTKKAHIVQAKNRFVKPAYSGYRDLLYHVLLDWPYKENVQFVAEIQVHHKDVLNLEKLFGLPNHYRYFRPIFAGPDRSVIQTMRDLEVLRTAKRIDESLIGKLLQSDDPDQLFMYAKLFYQKLENYNVALQIYSRVLTLQEASIGEIHPKTSATYQDIGLVQARKGDYDQALRSLQKCLEIQEQVFGPYSPEVANTRSHLGHTIVERGDDGNELMEHRGALQQYRKALVIREKCLGEDHLDVAGSYQNIGESLCKLGDFQGALAAYRESLSILESLLGEHHADVAIAHSLLGHVLYQQGDYQGAMEEYSIALAIREEVFGKAHQTTADSHTEIGKLLAEVQDYEEAESRHRKALRIRETVVNKDSPEAAESHYWIGYVLNQKGDYKAALVEHKIAYAIRAKILTKRHPATKASLRSVRANENGQQEP